MNIESDISYSGSFSRGIAVMIDVFIVAVLRIISAQILGMLWIEGVLVKLAEDFKLNFGSEAIENQEHVEYLTSHPAFTQIILFWLILLFVGAFYHAYFNSSSWKATVGKRIMGVMIFNNKFEKISFFKACGHYFLSLVPMILVFYLVGYQAYYQISFAQSFSSNGFNILLGFFAALWINIHAFTDKKVTAHDLICGTIFVDGKSLAKKPWDKLKKDEI